MSRRLVLLAIITFISLGTGVHWLREHVLLAWNETDSLPQSIFLVWKDEMPERGDYIYFNPPKEISTPYPFLKQVAGVGGDIISVKGRLVHVAGQTIGVAKPTSRKGQSLQIIAPGVIPSGHYFVHTDHRDSYDSRYQSIGLVPDARVIGRAIPLF